MAIRCRPLLRSEVRAGMYEVAAIENERTVQLMSPVDLDLVDDPIRVERYKDKNYTFDYAFSQNATQREVFEKTTKRLVDDIVDGYNATCFAYGATGAGKTYT